MIGLLEVLERKTKGNRTPEEEQVLDRHPVRAAHGLSGTRPVRAGAGRRFALVAAAFLAAPLAGAAAQDDKVIDVRATRPPVGNSFEALWSAYLKAGAHGDQEGQRAALPGDPQVPHREEHPQPGADRARPARRRA